MGQCKRTKEQIIHDIEDKHKKCCVCLERKHFDYFYNMNNKNDKKSYRCKACDEAAGAKWAKENPKKSYESIRGRQLKHKYGISLEDYKELWEKQQYKCAICEGTENATTGDRRNWNFAVDHDHETGKVRGLLCNNCNRGLGLLQDNPELLRKAANYVEQ